MFMMIVTTVVLAAAVSVGYILGFENGTKWVYRRYRFGNGSGKPGYANKAELIHKETITINNSDTKSN